MSLGLGALTALLLGAPGAHATTTTVHFASTVAFSLDPICFNDSADQQNITVTAGTTVYACYKLADSGDTTAGPATNVSVTGSNLTFSGSATIAKNASFTWISSPFVPTATTNHVPPAKRVV